MLGATRHDRVDWNLRGLGLLQAERTGGDPRCALLHLQAESGAPTQVLLHDATVSVAVESTHSFHHRVGVAQSLCIAWVSGKGFVATSGTVHGEMHLHPNVSVSFWFEQLTKKLGMSGIVYVKNCLQGLCLYMTHVFPGNIGVIRFWNMFLFHAFFLKQHWSRVKISTVGSSYSLRVRAQIKFVRNLFLLCVPQDVCDLSTPSTMFPQEEVSR